MATVVYGVIDPAGGSMCLSVAGHPPPVLAVPGRPAKLLDLPADLLIGTGIAMTRRSTVVEIPAGSVLCMYTDGLVERRNRDIDEGLTRLCGVVDTRAPESVCAAIMAALTGRDQPEDDVAVLVVRHRETR
jgi:sigma-B regulation protein RsbU (phosphoserine phosphatase)